jgi:hypothetical protein
MVGKGFSAIKSKCRGGGRFGYFSAFASSIFLSKKKREGNKTRN